MELHHAYLVKGFLLGKDAPRPIMDAIDAIIEGIPVVTITGSADPLRGAIEAVQSVAADDTAPEAVIAGSRDDGPLAPQAQDEQPPPTPKEGANADKPKKTRAWSPEAREAARQRMIAMQARKRAEKEGGGQQEPPAAFSEKDLRITVPASRRKSQLTDDDWPEIKRMLAAGRDRKLIASDYDEDPEDLDFFIASCQRREAKPPGEASASPSGVTSDATQRPTW